MTPRPLVFDLDGTLIDSRIDIAKACNHALSRQGLSTLPEEQITMHVGNGARALLRGVLGGKADQVDFDALFKAFQVHYGAHPTECTTLMPGVSECLQLRHSRRLAICTNKPMHLTERVIEALDWGELFDVVVGPLPGDAVKPKPDLLLRVAHQLRVDATELVMIGDSPQDVGVGKAVGAHTVGVKGGFLPLQGLVDAGPDALLDSLVDLPDHLSKLEA